MGNSSSVCRETGLRSGNFLAQTPMQTKHGRCPGSRGRCQNTHCCGTLQQGAKPINAHIGPCHEPFRPCFCQYLQPPCDPKLAKFGFFICTFGKQNMNKSGLPHLVMTSLPHMHKVEHLAMLVSIWEHMWCKMVVWLYCNWCCYNVEAFRNNNGGATPAMPAVGWRSVKSIINGLSSRRSLFCGVTSHASLLGSQRVEFG